MSAESRNPLYPSSRDYLLGRLSEEDERAADERAITDRAYYEELISEEEFLIEEFVAGHLPPADVIDFRRQCSLRPDLRERLALEEVLRRVSALSSEPEKAAIREPECSPASDGLVPIPRPARGRTSPLLFIGVAASLIVILLGSTIYLTGQLRSERHVAREREGEWHKRNDEQRGTIAELQKRIQTSSQPGSAPQRSTEASRPDPQKSGVGPLLATLLLHPTERGNDTVKEILLPPSRGFVELQLNIGTDTNFDYYRIDLTEHGSAIARATSRPRRRDNYRVVSMRLPVNAAGQRTFVAVVTGVGAGGSETPVASFSFTLKH